MAADWNNPTNATTYTDVLSLLRERDIDIAMGFSDDSGATLGSNLSTGTIKFNKNLKKWQVYSGTSWSDLETRYDIDVEKLDGQSSDYYRNAGNINAGTIGDARLPATITSNITGYVKGDVQATDGTTILDSGTNGDDAVFTGSVTGNATSAGSSVYSTGVKNTNATPFQVLTVGSNATGTDATFSGTSALATSITCTSNNTTNETVYPLFVDGSSGTQGAETDTGFTYNPNTGKLSMLEMQADNINIQGNTISTTTGHLTLAPYSTNDVIIGDLSFDGSSIWSSGATVTVSDNLSVTGDATFDGGTSTTVSIICDDAGVATLEAIGGDQGTGRVYVGQSGTHGGGIEYNGDSDPASTGAGDDFINIFRRSSSVDEWTMRNFHNSNNWEFRNNIQVNGAISIDTTTVIESDAKIDANKIKNVPAAWTIGEGTDTTYLASSPLSLTGTTFSLLTDNRFGTTTDVKTGNGHDYVFADADVGLRFYTANEEEMQLTDSGDLHVDGSVVAYSDTVSDRNLKTAISTVEDALTKVSQLNGVEFTRKDSGKRSAGVIAQDVEKVLPQAVTERALPLHADGGIFKTVEYDALHSLYIEAIKELKDMVEEQAVQIKELQGT
jgi:hypothetical protein